MKLVGLSGSMRKGKQNRVPSEWQRASLPFAGQACEKVAEQH